MENALTRNSICSRTRRHTDWQWQMSQTIEIWEMILTMIWFGVGIDEDARRREEKTAQSVKRLYAVVRPNSLNYYIVSQSMESFQWNFTRNQSDEWQAEAIGRRIGQFRVSVDLYWDSWPNLSIQPRAPRPPITSISRIRTKSTFIGPMKWHIACVCFGFGFDSIRLRVWLTLRQQWDRTNEPNILVNHFGS